MEIVLPSLGQSREMISSSEGEIRCHLSKGGCPNIPTERKFLGHSEQFLYHARNTEARKVKDNSSGTVIYPRIC